MGELVNFPKTLWALSVAGQCVLLALLISRRAYREYLAFTLYLLATILQNAFLFIISGYFSLSAYHLWQISWTSQGFVVGVRAFAVAEVCRHFVGRYRGIWVLARGILISCGVVVLIGSVSLAKHEWNLTVLYADRGLELALAAVIVTLFVFARYYALAIESTSRWLAIGFFFYSCSYVLNNTVFERWLNSYLALWNLLGTAAFVAILLLWMRTFHSYHGATASDPILLPANVYRQFSPEVNLRLRRLNERLSEFWSVGTSRS